MQRAKKEAVEKVNQVEEIGGIKYAPLQKGVDVGDSGLTYKKNTENAEIFPQMTLTPSISPPVFTSSVKAAEFAPLEKTPQQLKEEELERKMNEKNDLALKGKGAGWLGSKANEPKQPVPEFKVSAWATNQGGNQVSAPVKFAPLQKSQQEMRYERQEQEFKFTNKKEQEERLLKREAELAQKGVEATKPKP